MSLPEFPEAGREIDQTHRDISTKRRTKFQNKNLIPPKHRKRNQCFSLTQSNILYCIFLFNYLFILAIDFGIQIKMKQSGGENGRDNWEVH